MSEIIDLYPDKTAEAQAKACANLAAQLNEARIAAMREIQAENRLEDRLPAVRVFAIVRGQTGYTEGRACVE